MLKKNAIITFVGLYQYKVMPFGLYNCGNAYQRFIDQVTRSLDFCSIYVDYILIALRSLEERKLHLRVLLDRFKQNGLILNKSKYEFAVSQLTFFGHHISPKGFQPIPEKVQAVRNFRKSKTMTHLRPFLGMLNYYKRFISLRAKTVRSLNSILSPTKSGKKLIKWSETAFFENKTKLSNAKLLVFSAPDSQTAILVDVSATGCSEVLQQKIEGKWKFLTFSSPSFNSTQTRYATFD